MRINILLTSAGTYVNPKKPLINYSPLNGESSSTLFYNQITLEFYNQIKLNPSGLYTPDNTSIITSGLSGTVQVEVWASSNSPYPIDLATSDIIDVSSACMIQWTGITEELDLTCTGITGANYINVLLDRN